MNAPPDQAARDAVRDDLAANLVVDAGAGTGKTTALVRRAVNLLRQDRATAQGVAAITFTEAAAAELRHRVRGELEAAASDPATDPGGRLAAALTSLDEAAFTTLHAFAQRILREFPLEAGLPPDFEVVTGSDDRIAFDRRWEAFLGDLLDDPATGSLLGRALDLGLSLVSLREFAEALDDAHDRATALLGGAALPTVEVHDMVATLQKAMDQRPSCMVADDLLLVHLDRRVAPLLEALERAADDDALVTVLARAPRVLCTRGTAAAWGDGKVQVAEQLAAAQRALEAQRERQQDAVARALAARVAVFVADAADARRRAGRLRFHDLLVLTRKLLETRPGVRAGLRERYVALLLDEFQDTDPLQLDIAVLLAGDGGRIDPGRLFLVGDPKQSIYRFRRADVAVYEQAKRTLPVRARSLTQNFRSVPGVLDWVNAAFAPLMGETAEDGAPPYEALHAERLPLPPAAGPAVASFGGPASGRAAEVRVLEASDVARAVRHVLDAGWQVTDPLSGRLRPVQRRDVAVLVRRHATVRLLERAFEDAGVPYRLATTSLVYSSEEVRDLVTLLQAVEDPTDEIAVVAALRHPALACDDRSLVDWRAAGGSWDYRQPAPEAVGDGPVARATGRLRDLHEQRWASSIGGLVERLITDLRLIELAFAHSRPRDRWRRLRFLADQAHAFHDAGGHLRGFLRWVERQTSSDVRVDEFVVEEPDDDAVGILTTHGAKGLEFPVVVLLGLDVDLARLPRHPRVLFHPGGGAEVSLGGDVRTAGWKERLREEKRLSAAEEVRLLYVGATRARDHLLVSLWHREGSRSHAAALLDLGTVAGRWSRLELRDAHPLQAPAAPPVSPAVVDELRDWQRAREERLGLADRVRVRAATALAREHAGEPAGEPWDDEPEDAQPSRKGRAGTSIGRAVHGVLQTVDLAAPGDIEVIARAQAAVERVPGEHRLIARLARSALQSPSVRAAATAERVWREVHVGALVEGIAIEGFVDLLVEDRGKLVVVDYKTDQLRGRTAADVAARYHPQAAAYALAIEAALGRGVLRCVFVFARPPGAEEILLAGADLDRAKEDVRIQLRQTG